MPKNLRTSLTFFLMANRITDEQYNELLAMVEG